MQNIKVIITISTILLCLIFLLQILRLVVLNQKKIQRHQTLKKYRLNVTVT